MIRGDTMIGNAGWLMHSRSNRCCFSESKSSLFMTFGCVKCHCCLTFHWSAQSQTARAKLWYWKSLTCNRSAVVVWDLFTNFDNPVEVIVTWSMSFDKTRVPTPPGKSWKVLDFFFKFPGPGKSWKITLVPESPGHWSLRSWKVLENILENYPSLKSPASLALNLVSWFSAK